MPSAARRGPKPRRSASPNRRAAYRDALARAADWDAYLLRHSGLPGPRANLELAQVAAETAGPGQIRGWCALGPERAPADSRQEFLAFCGVLGVGVRAARGDSQALAKLGRYAEDPRWRIREAVALGLQRVGERDWKRLLKIARSWARRGPLVQRAAVAALAEPRLLRPAARARPALAILNGITRDMASTPAAERKDAFLVLRQGLAYGWSVVVAAEPEVGKPSMERWMRSADPDLRWMMQQNLSKARLVQADSVWVSRWKRILASQGTRAARPQ